VPSDDLSLTPRKGPIRPNKDQSIHAGGWADRGASDSRSNSKLSPSKSVHNLLIGLVGDVLKKLLATLLLPNMETIIQVVAAFDKQFGEDLRKTTEGKLKDGVDSIVSNRNQIAHGQSVGLSLGTLKDYYQSANSVIGTIDGYLS